MRDRFTEAGVGVSLLEEESCAIDPDFFPLYYVTKEIDPQVKSAGRRKGWLRTNVDKYLFAGYPFCVLYKSMNMEHMENGWATMEAVLS